MNEINYTVSFNKPFTHYCEVEISLKDLKNDNVIFSMPVWTPGSYLIREFAKNVEGVYALNSAGVKLNCEKINKNSWQIDCKTEREVNFRYRVYCNELTVRTSEINSEHAFLSSSGIFMFVRGFENKKCIVNLNLPEEWKKVSTGLTKISETTYEAENYDILVDSPIETGNQNIIEFEINGIKHSIALCGKGNYDEKVLIKDFKTIAEEEIKLFGGEIPYKSYTYIIHLVEQGGGGLEHLNSFVVQIPRWAFTDKSLYKKFLGLVSHEFFHLWNVKRIRPEALGPFDYDNENHSKGLWVAEGWTSFYDNLILRRCNLISNEEYYEFLDSEVNDVMRTEGRLQQSLEESSFDAWIKFYRKDENYSNAQVSYYTKGSLVALMLNLEIIKSTDSERSLDDALRLLYEDYKKDNSKGYSDKRVKEICSNVCGKDLDFFWKKYISGTDDLPVNEYLNFAGLEMLNTNDELSAKLDVEIKDDNGRVVITKVIAGYSAFESGLNFNDEIIAINGIRVKTSNLKNITKDLKIGEEIKVLISRKGLIMELEVKLLMPVPNYSVAEMEDTNAEQNKILSKWLTGIN